MDTVIVKIDSPGLLEYLGAKMNDHAVYRRSAPLAQIRRFVCMERRLTKTDILQTDIQDSINTMIQNKTAPIALRVNAQLLLGVVKVYLHKVRYLLDDCNQTVSQIRLMHQWHKRTRLVSDALKDQTLVTSYQDTNIVDLDMDRTACTDLLLGFEEDHDSERLKRTFDEMLPAEPIKATQHEDDSVSDYGDLDLELDLGDSPLFISPPATQLNLRGSADPPSPMSLYGSVDPPSPRSLPGIADPMSPLSLCGSAKVPSSLNSELVEGRQLELKRPRKRRRTLLVKDKETVIPLADLQKQQLNTSSILKPRSPRSASLQELQRILATGFAHSLFQGPQNCAPEIKKLLSIDHIRANQELQTEDAVDVSETEFRQLDIHVEEDLKSNSSGNAPLDSWSEEEDQPLRTRLITAASGESGHFQDILPSLRTQDISECFMELLVLATQGTIEIEQNICFGDIRLSLRSEY